MSLSKKTIDESKEIFEKEYGKKLSDQEAYESSTNLVGLFEVLYKSAEKERQRKYKLRKDPEGKN